MVITAVTCCYVWCIIILFVAPTTAPSTSNKNTGAIIGGVIGGVVFIIIVIVLVVYFTRRDDKRKLWYQVFLYFFSLRRNFHSKVSFLKVPLERLFTLRRFLYEWKCEISAHADLNRKIVWPKKLNLT